MDDNAEQLPPPTPDAAAITLEIQDVVQANIIDIQGKEDHCGQA